MVNITMLRDEPPSLIRKAPSAPCAIPNRANRDETLCAMFMFEPRFLSPQTVRDLAAALQP